MVQYSIHSVPQCVLVLLLSLSLVLPACSGNMPEGSDNATDLVNGNQVIYHQANRTISTGENQTSRSSSSVSYLAAENRTDFVAHHYSYVTIANDTNEVLNVCHDYMYSLDLSPHSEGEWVMVHSWDRPVTFLVRSNRSGTLFYETKTGKEWQEGKPIVIGPTPPPATNLLRIENSCWEPVTVIIDGHELTRIDQWMTARYYYPVGKSVLHISAVNDSKKMTCSMTYQVPETHQVREVVTLRQTN